MYSVLAVQPGQDQQLVDGLLEERDRVTHELQRSVDLVRDPGSELTDRLQAL